MMEGEKTEKDWAVVLQYVSDGTISRVELSAGGEGGSYFPKKKPRPQPSV